MGFNPLLGAFNRRNVVTLYHQMTLTITTGAIASQDSPSVSGITVVKTAAKTGRYTYTLPVGPTGYKFRQLLSMHAVLVGPDDTAFGAPATGLVTVWRDEDIDRSFGGASALDGTMELQFIRSDTGADAEVGTAITVFARFEVEI